jgi:hypothetical protein
MINAPSIPNYPVSGLRSPVSCFRAPNRCNIPAPMLGTAAVLAPMTVLDADRTPVVLGTLWRDRPAVLAFVRHFG